MDDPASRCGAPNSLSGTSPEPRIEHVHLALGDGYALGLAIRDAPVAGVMLHRPPPPALPTYEVILEVVGQNAGASAHRDLEVAKNHLAGSVPELLFDVRKLTYGAQQDRVRAKLRSPSTKR